MDLSQVLDRVYREKVLIVGAVTAVVGFLALVGVPIDPKVLAAAMTACGALFALLRAFVTPSSEVVAQELPGRPVTATSAAQKRWGLSSGAVVRVTDARAHPPKG